MRKSIRIQTSILQLGRRVWNLYQRVIRLVSILEENTKAKSAFVRSWFHAILRVETAAMRPQLEGADGGNFKQVLQVEDNII